MAENYKLTNAERAPLDVYLSEVTDALEGAGMHPREVETILADLESQFFIQLEQRAPAGAKAEDIDAVLAGFDPPQAFSESLMQALKEPKPLEYTGPQRLSRAAVWGAAWAPLFFINTFLFLTAHQVALQPGQPPPGPAWWQYVLMFTLLPLGIAAPFGTTILGLVALSQIRATAGRITGVLLAFCDAWFFPLLVLDTLIFVLLFKTVERMRFSPHVEEILHTLAIYIGIGLCGWFDYRLLRETWRRVRRRIA